MNLKGGKLFFRHMILRITFEGRLGSFFCIFRQLSIKYLLKTVMKVLLSDTHQYFWKYYIFLVSGLLISGYLVNAAGLACTFCPSLIT